MAELDPSFLQDSSGGRVLDPAGYQPGDLLKGGDGPLARGMAHVANSVRSTGSLLTGDYANAAQLAADRAAYQQANPGSPEGQALMAAYDAGEGITGGVKNVANKFAMDWQQANSPVGGVRATAKNLGAMGAGIIEQIPNMVPPMAGMLAGGAAGSYGGLPGAVAGGWAGATAGNTTVEAAEQIDRALQKAGIDPRDTAATEAFLAKNGDRILGQAGLKGGIIGAVDTATLGLGHGLLTAPARAASERALKAMGVDMLDSAAVKTATKLPEFGARIAADVEFQASKKGLGAFARNATVAGLEPAGEFAGEYLGQGAATGDWDTKGAALEAAMAIGQGGITFAGQKLVQGALSPGRKAKPGDLEAIKAGQVAGLDADLAELAAARGMYSAQAPGVAGQLEERPVIVQNPTTGQIVELDRRGGALERAAVDAVESGTTDSLNFDDTSKLLLPYANRRAAQDYIDRQADPEMFEVAPHPRVQGRFAALPKTGQARDGILIKRAAAAANEASAVRAEQLRAEEEGAPKESEKSKPATKKSAPAAAAAKVAPDNTADAAQDELAPAPVQPVSSMPAAQQRAQAQASAAVSANQTRAEQLRAEEEPQTSIDAAAARANTAPTERQKQAGNYAKGHIRVGSIDIAVENPAGSVRTGVAGGKSWKTKLKAHYGYVKATSGADGDAVDVYVKQGTAPDHSGPVFIVDQYNPGTGEFDEHKGLIGYGTKEEAAKAYDAHFGDKSGPKRRGAVTQMTAEEFKAWVTKGDTKQPIASEKFGGQSSDPAQAAQDEIAQSIGVKMSRRRAAESADAYHARMAAEANQRRASRVKKQAVPTKAGDQAQVQEVLKTHTGENVEASILSPGALPDVGKTEGVSKQAAQFIEQVARVFGKRVVFFDTRSEEAETDGFYLRGDAIYLNTKSSVAHLRVLGHELTHAMRAEAGAAYDNMLRAVSDLLTDAELKAQHQNYFGEALDLGQLDLPYSGEQTLRDFLAEEWIADLSGNRFAESSFWSDVFAKIEETHGTEASRGIVARLRLALVKVLNKLMALVKGNAFAVDARQVENLESIRGAIAEGFAEYGRRAKAEQLTESGAAGAKFASPNPAFKNQTLPARWPTSKKIEPPNVSDPLFSDIATLKQDEAQYKKAVAALLEDPGLHFPGAAKATTDEKAEYVIERMKNNLLWLYDAVPEAMRERSKQWYVGGRAIAERWAEKYDISEAQAAGALAVLSPQKDWFQNVTMAERVLDIVHTKKDHRFDDRMRAAAFGFLTKDSVKSDPESRRNLNAYEAIKNMTLGRVLARHNLREMSVWIRAYDEAYHDARHAIITPEGDFVEDQTTVAGLPTMRAWSDFVVPGKAASVMIDGTPENINQQLGQEHKVRNFYNNIFAPESPRFLTADTHAVAANELRALAGKDKSVKENFGKTGGTNLTGLSGTYAIHQEAYVRAAEARGVLPREMQSITWEAIRGLFTPDYKGKKANVQAIDAIWKRVDDGEISVDEARAQVLEHAGGFKMPDWWQEGNAEYKKVLRDKTYLQQRAGFVGAKVTFEVAPDPRNVELKRRWDALPVSVQNDISYKVAWKISAQALASFGDENMKGELHMQLGGWLDDTNPSLSIWLNKRAAATKTSDLTRMLGFALNQMGMMRTSAKTFKGMDGKNVEPSGLIVVNLPKGADVHDTYLQIRAILGPRNRPFVSGHTSTTEQMAIIHGDEKAISTKDLAKRISEVLGEEYKVGDSKIYAEFPEKGRNSYGLRGALGLKPGSPLRARSDQLRAEANVLIEQLVSEAGRKGKSGAADAEAGLAQEVKRSAARAVAEIKRYAEDNSDSFFRTPKITEKSMAGIVAAVSPTMTLREVNTGADADPAVGDFYEPRADKMWSLSIAGESANGAYFHTAYIARKNSAVWVNVGGLQSGDMGSRVYQVAGAYAHNNGLQLIGDPDGITEAGKRRRLENMISLALKYGTTQFMAPHEDMIGWNGLKWFPRMENLPFLLQTSHNVVAKIYPEINDVSFNFDTGKFERSGTVLGRSDFEDMASELRGRLGTNASGAPGSGTLRQAVLFKSLVSQEDTGRGLGALLADGLDRAEAVRASLNEVRHSRARENLYASIETRPGTTEEQRASGGAAIEALERRVAMLRTDGGQAATVLGASILRDFTATGTSQLVGKQVSSAADLAALAQVYRDPRFETLRVIYTRAGEVVGEAAYSSRLPGTVRVADNFTQNLADDKFRFDAQGYWLVHNHPGGKSFPSTADERVTAAIAGAVQGFQGHVIIDHNEFTVLDHTGKGKVILAPELNNTDFRAAPAKDHPFLGRRVSSPKHLARMAKEFSENGQLNNPILVFLGGSQGTVDLIVSAPLAAMQRWGDSTARAKAWIRGAGRSAGAGARVFLLVPDTLFESQQAAGKALVREQLVTDVVSDGGLSLRWQGVAPKFDTVDLFSGRRGAIARYSPSRAQTKTPEFKAWFGDSAVVDPDGRPLVVYHGTTATIDSFSSEAASKSNHPSSALGFFFSESWHVAEMFNRDLTGAGGFFDVQNKPFAEGANTVPSYLSIQKPKVLSAEEFKDLMVDLGTKNPDASLGWLRSNDGWKYIREQFEGAGFDGVKILPDRNQYKGSGNEEYTVSQWVAFSPNQIKSAVGNTGEFSRENDDIRFSPPRFFSQLERAFKQAPAKLQTQPAPQWKLWLAGTAGKLGVKKDEIEWSGITDWLDAKGKEKVSREEIADYLAHNGVQVEDVTLDDFTFEAYQDTEDPNAAVYGDWVLPGGENYREMLITLPSDTPTEDRGTAYYKDTTRDFQSSHFPQPNILAHLRFNERTGPAGERVLFLEEIQSDWAQKGRAEGFDNEAAFEKLIRERDAAPDDSPQQDELQRRIDEMGARGGKGVPSAPFVTNTKSWTGLALKRAILLAAQNGFDKIAWTTGEQQADRYDLSKKVDRIEYEPAGKGLYEVKVFDKAGVSVFSEDEIDLERIEEVIGKDLAKKIEAGEGERAKSAYRDWRVLSGLDLKVGGEGMLAYYDKIVPQVASDILRKTGGGKVESIALDLHNTKEKAFAAEEAQQFHGISKKQWDNLTGREQSRLIDEYWAQDLSTQPSITITPEIRKVAEGEGFPLFSRVRKVGDIPVIENPTRQQAKVMLDRSAYKELRGLQDPESGQLWVWDAAKLLHAEAAEGLGLTDEHFTRLLRQTDGFGHGLLNIRNLEYADSYPYRIFSGERTLPVKPEMAFSAARATLGPLTPAQEQAANNVLGTPKTFMERLAELKKDWAKNLKQGIFDQFAPIADIDQNAYIQARLSKGGDSTLEALMLYGKLSVGADGATNVQYTRAGGLQGFASKMAALKGEQERFMLWVAAQRADRLKGIGLENLWSASDIAELKGLNLGTMQDGTARLAVYAQALRDLNDFNDNVLSVAVASGLIDDSTRQLYRDTPYVPFYRLNEDDEATGFNVKPGLVNQYAWKKLKGGTAKLNEDLTANLLHNWSHLITASAKNRAAKATLDAAERAGIAGQIPAGTPGRGHVSYKEAGKEKVFIVSDPHLADAVMALEYVGLGPWAKPFAAAKHWLTLGVTANPAFKIRNLIRDSIAALGTADLSYNAPGNVKQGWAATAQESETRASMLAAGGMIRFGSMLDGKNSQRAQDLINSGVDPDLILDSDSKIKKFYKRYLHPALTAYNELGDRSEQINRAALYEQMIAKGMSHAEAAFWARDLLDFSMGGKWTAIRTITQTVPFFNARLQGLYKLGRAGKQDIRRLGYVLGAVSLASLALVLAYEDDDDWKRRSDADRNNYWWFKIGGVAARVPKPFEIGAVGTLAERGYELMFNPEMTGQKFGKNLSELVLSQLSMNPVPQLVKPMMDIYANKDSFTGRDIETLSQQRLRKQDRYDEKSSEVARFLGGLGLPDPTQLVMGRWGTLSPKQFDFLARAYFSWLGAMVTTALDYGIRPALDRGEKPAMQLRDVFLLGNFVETLPSNSSSYVQRLYDQSREIEQAYASYRSRLKLGDVEGAQAILAEEQDNIRLRKVTANRVRAEALINQQLKQVEANQAMTAEEKRARVDALYARRNTIAEAFARQQR